MLASQTFQRSAEGLPQELSHWFCSQNHWLSIGKAFTGRSNCYNLPDELQGLKLGLKFELCCINNELLSVYLSVLQNPRTNYVEFEFFSGLLHMWKLRQVTISKLKLQVAVNQCEKESRRPNGQNKMERDFHGNELAGFSIKKLFKAAWLFNVEAATT